MKLTDVSPHVISGDNHRSKSHTVDPRSEHHRTAGAGSGAAADTDCTESVGRVGSTYHPAAADLAVQRTSLAVGSAAVDSAEADHRTAGAAVVRRKRDTRTAAVAAVDGMSSVRSDTTD